MCITFKPCSEPTLPGVYWRDDDSWRPYDLATASAILHAAGRGLLVVALGNFSSPVYPSGAPYELDLANNQQRNTQSGQTRPIKFVPDISLQALRTETAAANAALVWPRLVEAFVSEPFVKHSVTAKVANEGLAVATIKKNPYLVPGSVPFQKFVAKLSAQPITEASSILNKAFSKMVDSGPSKLKLVFHGPRVLGNVNSILQNGMDPRKRNYGGDWFSRTFTGATSYAPIDPGLANKKTVVVFYILLERHIVEQDSDGVLVVSDAAYELPVATVVA